MKFRRLLQLLLLVLGICVFRSLLDDQNSSYAQTPLIVIYLNKAAPSMSRKSLEAQFRISFDNCKWKCAVSTDQELTGYSSAVIFEARQISASALPIRNSSDQIFVFFSLESPMFPAVSSNLKKVSKHYFNRTMTYRMDSDYPIPYDRFTTSKDVYNESYVEQVIASKSHGVLMVVSKCFTPGKRERFVRKLRKFVDIRFFGKCAKKLCDMSCLKKNVKKARFYLSLENSVCDEYITEKVFRMKELIVPIVLRKTDYVHVLPPGSFISVDQFNSAEELSIFITYLNSNHTAYREFFNWTQQFGFQTVDSKSVAFCRLCSELHEQRRRSKSVEDIWKWWGAGKCDKTYFSRYSESFF